jgi:transposase
LGSGLSSYRLVRGNKTTTWSFAAPYLALMDVTAPQRKYELRDMFDALRWMARAGAPWRRLPNDFPP